MNVKPVLLIWEAEFSQLVRDTYGRPYQLQQQDGCLGQETIVSVKVPDKPRTWLADDAGRPPTLEVWVAATPPEPMTDAWDGDLHREHLRWHREFYPELQDVVNDLHRRGLMAAGEYVIHIWW